MNATELATLSIKELKSFCTANSIEVTGDKRSKATYISAIETFQSLQTVTDFETDPLIDLPLMEAAEMAESIVQETGYASETPAPQPPTLIPHISASIVVLIPLILMSALFNVMGMGLRSLVPLIAAVVRLSAAIWGFSNREDVPTSFVLISSAQS